MHAHINLHLSDDTPPPTANAGINVIAVSIGHDVRLYGTRAQLVALAKGIQEALFQLGDPEPAAPYSLGARVEWTTDGAVPTEVRTDA